MEHTTIKNVHDISTGRVGTWFIQRNTRELYYIKTLTDYDKSQGKKENENILIQAPSDGQNERVVSTMFNVYLVQDSNDIYIRDGITTDQPTGKQWLFYKKGKDISESKFVMG